MHQQRVFIEYAVACRHGKPDELVVRMNEVDTSCCGISAVLHALTRSAGRLQCMALLSVLPITTLCMALLSVAGFTGVLPIKTLRCAVQQIIKGAGTNETTKVD